MYNMYEELPIGVMILESNKLNIRYMNKKFSTTFNIEENFLEKNIDVIKGFNSIKPILKNCYENKLNKNINNICIYNKYFDFIVNYKNNVLIVYTYEITFYKNNTSIDTDKCEFFNVILHELRTPLTIICSSVQFAKSIYKSQMTPDISNVFNKINKNCKILLKLLNNILDISKSEAGFLQANYSYFDIVFVTENLTSCINLYAKNKGIELIFDTTKEEAIVSLDKDKYEKIILNLLSNAIKFTPKGKKIMVTTVIEKDYVEIKVKDKGIGIPEDKIDNIFNRFAQINNQFLSNYSTGTGLGLVIVKKFVELMNGKIKVNSKVGIGTEFIIRFNHIVKKDKNAKRIYDINFNIDNKIAIQFAEFN